MGTFYIGTTQPALGGSDSLYLGLDVNRTGANHLYINVSGFWEASTASGAIMVRPVVGPVIPSQVTEVKAALKPWSVYPNPASDQLNFEYFNYEKPVQYLVTNIEGRVVMNGTVETAKSINIAALKPGIYFVKLQGQYLDTKPQKIVKL
ncbi:MAG: T9SS type A sorting domain-containing protein [Sphingobacteriales bacterium]|nr:MAG: T9SS type A sorting domain-containing protein [Sphingobacteriales bacterium]